MNEKQKPIFDALETLAPTGMMQVQTQGGATIANATAAKPVYDSGEVKRVLLARFIAKRNAEKRSASDTEHK